MGWRLSWYKADKKQPIKMVEEENEPPYPEINGEKMLYAEGTGIWWDIDKETKHNPKYFKELYPDEDCDYFEVYKDGLKLFIDRYTERIIDVLKEGLKDDNDRNSRYPSIRSYAEEKLKEWEWGLVYHLDDNDKHEITSSWKYEYTIFNLIALYKSFDFEKYSLVVYGG